MPAHWWAKKRPVRPYPDWISSRISTVPVRSGRLAQRAKESLLGAADARHALNAFDDHGGELARGELALDRPDVVQRHELHVGRGVEGRADRGIVGHLDGARRTAVESSAEGQHLGPPVWNDASFRAFSLASAPELQRKSR